MQVSKERMLDAMAAMCRQNPALAAQLEAHVATLMVTVPGEARERDAVFYDTVGITTDATTGLIDNLGRDLTWFNNQIGDTLTDLGEMGLWFVNTSQPGKPIGVTEVYGASIFARLLVFPNAGVIADADNLLQNIMMNIGIDFSLKQANNQPLAPAWAFLQNELVAGQNNTGFNGSYSEFKSKVPIKFDLDPDQENQFVKVRGTWSDDLTHYAAGDGVTTAPDTLALTYALTFFFHGTTWANYTG